MKRRRLPLSVTDGLTDEEKRLWHRIVGIGALVAIALGLINLGGFVVSVSRATNKAWEQHLWGKVAPKTYDMVKDVVSDSLRAHRREPRRHRP